jgi:hypothetical protein
VSEFCVVITGVPKDLAIRCQDIVHNPCIQDIVQFNVSCI